MRSRRPRIHVDGALAAEASQPLPAGAARHVAQVLRLRPGDTLVLFDGRGGEVDAEIERVAGAAVTVRTGARRERERESPLAVTLGLAVARGERMDVAVQKAAELGVQRIVPLLTRHGVVRLAGDRAERRAAHWRAVVAHACEQCGRNRLPEVAAVTPVAALLEDAPGSGGAWLLDPDAGTPLAGLPRPAGALTLLVGPEGGWHEHEVAAAGRAGWTRASLGPRVLRTETAAIAALAAAQVLWGDLGA